MTKRFAQNNPPEWFTNAIANSYDNNGQRRSENLNTYVVNIMSDNRWGDPEVEGRIHCGKYGVKLHVVESNPLHTTDKQQDPFLHQLIDSSGSKNAGEYNRVDYNDNSVLHIVNRGHAHFEPLLNRNKILAKQTQEQQDFLLAKQLQEQEDLLYAKRLQGQEQKDSLLAKEVQDQEDLLYAKRLQGQEYAQSLNPRCSMEEVKIEDQQQQILVK